MKLQDKVAIITGGGGGVGREIALAFAGEGAKLVLVDINWKAAGAVAKEIRALGKKALAVRTDIRKEREVQRMVEKTLAKFGRIDILVNNAGIGFGPRRGWGPVKDLALQDWQNVLNINLTGAFICAKALLGSMMAQKSGVIINISSGMGKKGMANFGAYCASKFGIEALTQVLALELAPWNIRVNALAPGDRLATPPVLARTQGDPRGMLRPSVIRGAAVYLASEDAAGVTGQSLSAMQWNTEHGVDNAVFRIQ